MSRTATLVTGLLLSLTLAACGPAVETGEPDGGGADGGASDGGGDPDGGGGDGGVAWQCEPDPTLTRGAPVTAPAGAWTWVDVPESRCMDGSQTGFGIRMNPASDKLMIYLQGGGACFDRFTCATVANQNGFDGADFASFASSNADRGIFDSTDPANPVHDWNMVFVPYCSGDVHAGSAFIGAQNRTQIGWDNFRAALGRLVPTFEGASQVLLTGSSAGGFGAALNFPQTQEAFGCTRVDLLDDAGPPMADDYLKPCLQAQWKDLWNLEATLPADCADCFGADGGGIVNFMPYLAERYPGSNLGLLSSTGDQTIRTFFSYGYSADCSRPATMPAADFEAGLIDLRDRVMLGHSNAASFYERGDFHTFLGSNPGGHSVEGVDLNTWIGALVAHDPAWQSVGP
ncbi:MAG: pectin acetylesterase-family hydrolase [Deltaproteobacteria bacterium]|nr:pectin acetylesterase-family hydrolase [Deltaproteobacteria bacterium]